VSQGENIVVIAQTNVAVRALLDKALEIARLLDVPEDDMDPIIWFRNDSGNDGFDPEEVADFLTCPEESQQEGDERPPTTTGEWVKKAVRAVKVEDDDHPYAIRDVIRRDLRKAKERIEEIAAQKEKKPFQLIGTGRWDTYEMSLLKRLDYLLGAIRVHRDGNHVAQNTLLTAENENQFREARAISSKMAKQLQIA
jgi:hypothetical protein